MLDATEVKIIITAIKKQLKNMHKSRITKLAEKVSNPKCP